MTYAEFGVTLNAGSGVAASYVFAANGLFDPNISAVGHQPMGFDQLMALYNQYTVIGGIIKVTFSNSDPLNDQIIGITMKDSASTTLDPRQNIEWGNTTWSNIGARDGNSTKVLTHKFDIAKYAAQAIVDEQQFTGTNSVNPANTLHLVIWAAIGSAIGDPLPVNCNVEIMYDTIFKSPGATTLS